jgi:hypothetical protein
MGAQQRQYPLTQSPPGDIEPAQSLEKEWEGHLRNLQQCICELLIKNQQLRVSLMSATNPPME